MIKSRKHKAFCSLTEDTSHWKEDNTLFFIIKEKTKATLFSTTIIKSKDFTILQKHIGSMYMEMISFVIFPLGWVTPSPRL